MAQNDFEVLGRHFRSSTEYAKALRDKQTIEKIRKSTDMGSKAQLERLQGELENGKYRFYTLLGDDFKKEIRQKLKTAEMDRYVKEELKRQEKRRKRLVLLCSLIAAGCLGYVGFYARDGSRTDGAVQEMKEQRDNRASAEEPPAQTPYYTLDDKTQQPAKEVLDEYKSLVKENKKLIGWVKIDDTNIDYPVMQTTDNEYYLTHNMNQENDRNGAIFLDKDCDVLKPSTNYIIYGHHMRSGKMFGGLDKYEKESYYKDHPYIQFDTIYEKGFYEVMYVFRSRVYREDEIVFKYYQFIDANSEQEFDSYMDEMAAISLYDTGVTAQYGDQLLTLSTCDYQEKNGRFVVVAKKIAKE